VKRVKFLMMKS